MKQNEIQTTESSRNLEFSNSMFEENTSGKQRKKHKASKLRCCSIEIIQIPKQIGSVRHCDRCYSTLVSLPRRQINISPDKDYFSINQIFVLRKLYCKVRMNVFNSSPNIFLVHSTVHVPYKYILLSALIRRRILTIIVVHELNATPKFRTWHEAVLSESLISEYFDPAGVNMADGTINGTIEAASSQWKMMEVFFNCP